MAIFQEKKLAVKNATVSNVRSARTASVSHEARCSHCHKGSSPVIHPSADASYLPWPVTHGLEVAPSEAASSDVCRC